MASERARKAAEELFACLGLETWPQRTTLSAKIIDKHFPAYDALLAACRSALDTYEVQTGEDRPWKGNNIMDGAIAGSWLTTPNMIRAALSQAGVTP